MELSASRGADDGGRGLRSGVGLAPSAARAPRRRRLRSWRARLRPLTADDLTKETTAPALASGLSRWGFVVGSDRLFQAANHNRHSHRLQFVDSRTLLFRTPAGAAAYVRYVHDHPTEMFGAPPKQTALVSRGRHGWAIDLASCACHMSNPAVVGITSDGTRVTWLEINGATASTAKLAALMGKAP